MAHTHTKKKTQQQQNIYTHKTQRIHTSENQRWATPWSLGHPSGLGSLALCHVKTGLAEFLGDKHKKVGTDWPLAQMGGFSLLFCVGFCVFRKTRD